MQYYRIAKWLPIWVKSCGTGRKQDALRLWQQALAKDPANEALQDALKRFHQP
jgi:hypothetical protein